MTEPLYFTLPEAAELLTVSEDSLKRAVSGGVVPYSRPFGLDVVRFSHKDLEDIVAKSRIEPIKSPSLTTPLRPRRSRKAAA